MSNKAVGLCGKCGGTVCIPVTWNGVDPPVPQCSDCKAFARSHLPTLEMTESKDTRMLLLEEKDDDRKEE